MTTNMTTSTTNDDDINEEFGSIRIVALAANHNDDREEEYDIHNDDDDEEDDDEDDNKTHKINNRSRRIDNSSSHRSHLNNPHNPPRRLRGDRHTRTTSSEWSSLWLWSFSIQIQQWLREARHNRYLMIPLAVVVLCTMGLVAALTVVVQVPVTLVSFVCQGLLRRTALMIEFLYPSAIGKFVHITLMETLFLPQQQQVTVSSRLTTTEVIEQDEQDEDEIAEETTTTTTTNPFKKKKPQKPVRDRDSRSPPPPPHPNTTTTTTTTTTKPHSRTTEMRIEIVPERIYLHPLPQLMDNLGYVLVCLPPPSSPPLPPMPMPLPPVPVPMPMPLPPVPVPVPVPMPMPLSPPTPSPPAREVSSSLSPVPPDDSAVEAHHNATTVVAVVAALPSFQQQQQEEEKEKEEKENEEKDEEEVEPVLNEENNNNDDDDGWEDEMEDEQEESKGDDSVVSTPTAMEEQVDEIEAGRSPQLDMELDRMEKTNNDDDSTTIFTPLPFSSRPPLIRENSTFTVDETQHNENHDHDNHHDNNKNNNNDNSNLIIGILVDCGSYESVQAQLARIYHVHYRARFPHSTTGSRSRPGICIRMILSTHKHHDHTAGNAGWQRLDPTIAIVGSAVENVPCCNYWVSHGHLIQLPVVRQPPRVNDPNEVMQIQVICTPAHTRGSVMYHVQAKQWSAAAAYMFTGDTIFSGGSGAPFEADLDITTMGHPASRITSPTCCIRPTVGPLAMERCFAELLYHCKKSKKSGGSDRNNNDDIESSYRPPLDVSNGDTAAAVPSNDRIVILPGHEYTRELLQRQIAPSSALTNQNESFRWSVYSPNDFFETLSTYFVAYQRRNLPQSSGKLLTAISTLRRELLINPHFRMLRKRGEVLLWAIHHWHRHVTQIKIPTTTNYYFNNEQQHAADEVGEEVGLELNGADTASQKSESVRQPPHSASKSESSSSSSSSSSSDFIDESTIIRNSRRQWNLTATDLDRPVFTTVYAADLDSIIEQLQKGRMQPEEAAQHLQTMKRSMEMPIVGRRPVPDTLPSDKSMGKSLVAFCVLGSPPCALTVSDSKILKLPPPMVGSSAATASDQIRISKTRILVVLHALGLISISSSSEDDDHHHPNPHRGRTHYARIQAMLTQMWNEARAYQDAMAQFDPFYSDKNNKTHTYPADVDDNSDHDHVTLGALRWILFGIPRPATFLSKLQTCWPCCSKSNNNKRSRSNRRIQRSTMSSPPEHPSYFPPYPPATVSTTHHPFHTCHMTVHSGELVRHDVLTCLVCTNVTASGSPSGYCSRSSIRSSSSRSSSNSRRVNDPKPAFNSFTSSSTSRELPTIASVPTAETTAAATATAEALASVAATASF